MFIFDKNFVLELDSDLKNSDFTMSSFIIFYDLKFQNYEASFL